MLNGPFAVAVEVSDAKIIRSTLEFVLGYAPPPNQPSVLFDLPEKKPLTTVNGPLATADDVSDAKIIRLTVDNAAAP